MRKSIDWDIVAIVIFGVVVLAIMAAVEVRQPKPHTCETISTGPCPCSKVGSCHCVPGGRSCPACKDTRLPADQAKIDAAGLQEFAERSHKSK